MAIMVQGLEPRRRYPSPAVSRGACLTGNEAGSLGLERAATRAACCRGARAAADTVLPRAAPTAARAAVSLGRAGGAAASAAAVGATLAGGSSGCAVAV